MRDHAEEQNMTTKFDSMDRPFPSVDRFLPPSGLRMLSPETTESSKSSPLDASHLKITLSSYPRSVPALDSKEVAQHKICTDHMITARWTAEHGWADPELVPYGPFSLMPAASVLHYSTSCFEGMKVHRGYDGRMRLFRPEYNCGRMLASAIRIALPAFDPKELLKLIQKLCAVDGPKWLSKEDCRGQSLYIRPALVGSDSSLELQVPQEALLFIFLSCWPATPVTSGNGLRILGSRSDVVRTWPGGTGSVKIGGNYGPSLLAHTEAKRMGYDQVLWLFGSEGYATEAGAANFFVIWRTPEGRLQLVTASTSEHLILAGVTRQSILDIARERLKQPNSSLTGHEIEPLDVIEDRFTIFDIVRTSREGRLLGAFAVGTAYFMTPVFQIQYMDEDIHVPLDAVPHTAMLRKWILDINLGNENHEWGYVIDE